MNKTTENFYFYWLFESENDPSIDPVIVNVPGGVGYGESSLLSMMIEGGAFSIDDSYNIRPNPNRWNRNVSSIFSTFPL